MPAKFVNLIEFFELKITAELEAYLCAIRGHDLNGIVTRLQLIDIRPQKKFAIGQSRDRNAGMVK